MCGIATIAIGRSKRGRVPWPLVRKLTEELLVELQARGIDAAGIAIINDGPSKSSRSVVFKKPLRPTRLVERPKFKELVNTLIGPNTNFILLHARATTVGNTRDNFNNHPIVTDRVVGIHNGTLWNEDQIFKKYGLEREGAVDSEVIFRLYGQFAESGMDPRNAIAKTAGKLEGAFTGALVDTKCPTRLVMFKNDRSLCLSFLRYYDMVVATSEARFFSNAAKRVRLKAKGTSVFVEDGTGLVFDLDNEDGIIEGLEDFEIPAWKGRSKHLGGRAWVYGD